MALINYQLTVNYNANGGSGAPSSQTKVASSQSAPYVVSIVLSSTKPTRSGYTFLGWATSASGSVSYAAGDTYTHYFEEGGSYSATMYAVWKSAKHTFTSATAGEIGGAGSTPSPSTIVIDNKGNSYTHKITYSFGSAFGNVTTNPEKTTATTITWTPPSGLANQIPNATSGTCTLTCTTYNGDTVVGTDTKTITLYVLQSIKIKIGTVTTTESASMPSGISVFVQGKSKVAFSIATDTSNAYSASVVSCSTVINGKTYSGTSFTTDILSVAGSVTYTITLTDSRGRTDTKSASFYVYQYFSPTITASAARDATTNTHVNVSYTFSFASVNSQNTKQIKIEYKKTTDSSYSSATSGTITPSSTSGTSTFTITNTLDAAYPYNIRIAATDKWTTVYYTLTVASSGSRYIECDKSTGTIIFPLKTRHIGTTTFNDSTSLEKATGSSTYVAKRTDTNTSVSVGVGSDGYTHGVWSGTNSEWIIYKDASGNTRVPSAPIFEGHADPIGKITNQSPTASAIANNTWVTKITQAFSTGTYIISFGCLFGNNSTGYRRVVLSSTQNDSTAYVRAAQDSRVAVNGVVTQCSGVACISFDTSTTLYLNCYQNSGSSIGTNYPFMNIIRIL